MTESSPDRVYLVPGPTACHPAALAARERDFGSGDVEDGFIELYVSTQGRLQAALGTTGEVTMQTGEGMLALWGALKSVIAEGDIVVSVCNGVFGDGIAGMAEKCGATVVRVESAYSGACDVAAAVAAIEEHKPRLVTMVHGETPSGVINPVSEVGAACRAAGDDTLLYVDAVASAFGVPVAFDDWGVDLGLIGSQKVLSLPPDMCVVTVSDRAWPVIEARAYVGYDALLPWRDAVAKKYFPYTPSWNGVAGIAAALDILEAEGWEAVHARHEAAAAACRQGMVALGLDLFVDDESAYLPTCTAVCVPDGVEWSDLDAAFKAKGLVVGGSYGKLAGKVFRFGTMGTGADLGLVGRGLAIVAAVLAELLPDRFGGSGGDDNDDDGAAA